MLITRLALRNFRSYGAAVLDLSELRAATIVGRNGAGKSTLAVDAMLWALYGQVRGTGADSVVRIGETDCVVELDFEASGHAHRVVRKRSTRSRGKSELDLYRVAGEHLVPLSGRTLDDTQAEIERVVGVGLETLVAASVIQQGDAARFTSAAPEERRRILRSILGLERYKGLAADARRRAAEVQAQRSALGPDLDRADDLAERLALAVETRDGAEADERHAQARVAEAERAEHEARVAEADARAAAQVEQARLAERPALVARVSAAIRTVEDAESNAAFLELSADLTAVVGAERAIPAARQTVGEAEQAHEAARRAADAAAEKRRQVSDIEDQIEAALRRQPSVSAVEMTMARQAVEFVRQGEAEVDEARSACEQARADLQVQHEIAARVDDDENLVRLQTESDAARVEAERLAAEAKARRPDPGTFAAATGQAVGLRKQLDAAEKAAALLDEAPCSISPGPDFAAELPAANLPGQTIAVSWSRHYRIGKGVVFTGHWGDFDLAGTCPLLANAREARDALPGLRLKLAEAEDLAARLREDQKAADDLAALSRAKVEACYRLSEQRTALRIELVRKDRALIEAAQDAVRAAEERLGEKERALVGHRRVAAQLPGLEADEAQAQAVGAEIANLRARLGQARLEADASGRPSTVETGESLSRARAGLASLERIAAGRESAERAAAQLVDAKAAVERAKVALAEARAALDACKADESVVRRAEAAASDLRAAMANATAARGNHRAAVAELESARATVTRLEAEVAALAEKRAEAERLAEDARQWTRTAEALELAAVLLIERAIPVLEAEANAVLARISSRGMQVRLDTQRALKSREGMRETLDIVIRDDVGERPYEDFSGGEQFRVDMALRLALARLLAEREGFAVDMLVVDEGSFGALDAEGVGALKEVLAGLQSVYRLILVVTHIPDVADALPHRIEVRQGENGSEIAAAG